MKQSNIIWLALAGIGGFFVWQHFFNKKQHAWVALPVGVASGSAQPVASGSAQPPGVGSGRPPTYGTGYK